MYATKQLVEVAVRAMSPAINDPFTAISCLDHIGAGFSAYVDNDFFEAAFIYDFDGRLRLIIDPVSFADLLNEAFNMIRHASANNTEVLMAMLSTIETIGDRVTRPETMAELICHAGRVDAECQAGNCIVWDKEQVSRRCAEVVAHLQASPSAAARA